MPDDPRTLNRGRFLSMDYLDVQSASIHSNKNSAKSTTSSGVKRNPTFEQSYSRVNYEFCDMSNSLYGTPQIYFDQNGKSIDNELITINFPQSCFKGELRDTNSNQTKTSNGHKTQKTARFEGNNGQKPKLHKKTKKAGGLPPLLVDAETLAMNPFAFKNNRRMMTRDYKIKMKTELCSAWRATGQCKYGENCAFAHGEEEIRKKVHVPSMYKTKLCQQFEETGYCSYGHRCQFIHTEKPGETRNKDKKVSYLTMLSQNAQCLKERITSSNNPFLNEFNLIYKDNSRRLAVFESLQDPEDLTPQEKASQGLM